ncbi:(d)CMP kinase [Maridesulfovibrio hydrothermalis]|uniref:Cytidylate kinase n=1 Tax=Maridesulfovibrio hydrothermalis AM13 = DSM 14728 TaxID=1121451 RepID=L0R9F0_9BACT|nr:(d)CMP kinase [Maridesulfovibrio hydrothermalis]CCO22842.1 Cytidylate kinase [Maridesulfovibrio hydrothermalis AM13 = DSM 14728]
MTAPFIITLDGPAGVGKSTLAKRLADHFEIAYLDTGAMFRATAWKLGEGAWDWDKDKLDAALKELEFTLSGSGSNSTLSLNGIALTDEIRTEKIGMWASNMAKIPAVRTLQKTAQRKIGETTSLIAEGRDMGTVIFPQAPCKFFLDADLEERARRRFSQLEEMGKPADLKDLIEQIGARDDQDRNRKVAPLKPAKDGIIVDTTKLDIDGVFARLVAEVKKLS